MEERRSRDFMAMFGMKKTKPTEGSDLVLAYLEDAQRVRATLFAVDPKGRETQASLVAITEERVTLAMQGRVQAEKGEAVGLLFYLDGLRLRATPSRVQESKSGTLALDLPAGIELAERRKKPRARLNQREGATAIALTGLFDGVGLSGAIDNISSGGMCLKVGRAMNVKTQGSMHLGPKLLSVGDVFMLIKLNKLPKCPLIELGGSVTHVASEGSLLSVGIAFESGKEGLLGPVKALVATRSNTIPTSVPPKARRSQEAAPKAEEQPIELALPRPTPRKEPEPVPEPPAAPPAPEAQPQDPPSGAPALPDPPGRGSALLRVKKRTRTLLLAMQEGPDREALAASLVADGYGQVLPVATLTELLELLDRAQLVFVDGGVAEVQGLNLASLLRHKLQEDMPPVILAEETVDSELVMGAQEIGVAQVLVKPYELDQDFLRMIEGHLGIA
jgi:CheY-like chemotaxis protein